MAWEAEQQRGVQMAQGTVRRVARGVFEHLYHLKDMQGTQCKTDV